ncbi:MAG: SDR family NAD(P)-dependent oxidoreductase, partial [Actinobacteria bacterium]|nr:SDR family NAD(P)-dependent oxidoreductase [Actinomycetota bacterium]
MSDLTGKNIVITGASSGIGEALAIEASKRGARVAIVARRADRLADVLEHCQTASPESTMVVADLADLDAIEALAAQLITSLDGRVDVLINNAGVPKRKRTDQMTADDVEGVMAINYFSPVRLTLAMLPHMLERNSGDIINVSSMGVHMAAFGVSAYSASKAALEFFTEGLYVELGKTNVRAHLFVPGTTASEFSTDKPGNNAPFPSDPATTATSEAVAISLLASLDTETFVTYTGE